MAACSCQGKGLIIKAGFLLGPAIKVYISNCKIMSTDDGYNLTGPNPFICSLGRIIVIDSSSCGVRAVYSLPGSLISRISDRGVYTAVIQAGKGALLIDDA